eukprot:TRINITY_DN17501_c0_g1_i7.p1 TRINITY_DN17501_c0_g1~~TRINITY_DN17501_c0_g1_i7.p1  ORF type:complete len:119 (+),score=49.87 TRINITY_DN17501_c0_g1_i7:261-617(+)
MADLPSDVSLCGLDIPQYNFGDGKVYETHSAQPEPKTVGKEGGEPKKKRQRGSGAAAEETASLEKQESTAEAPQEAAEAGDDGFENLTYRELQKKAKSLKLKATGTKDILLQRIREAQ